MRRALKDGGDFDKGEVGEHARQRQYGGNWRESGGRDSAHEPGLSASLPDPSPMPPLPDPSPALSRHAAEV